MALAVAAAGFLQAMFPPVRIFGQAKAPLLLSLSLYYALSRPAGVAMAAAFLAGFLQDALSFVPLGYSAFCFAIVAAVAGRFRKTVLTEAVVTPVFFGAIAGAAATLGLYVLLYRSDLACWPAGRLLAKTAGAGILGAACAPAVFALAGRLDRLVGLAREVEEFDGLE
jgi:rod shape-determining protein MreD